MTVVQRNFDTSDPDEAVKVFSTAFDAGSLQLSQHATGFRYAQDYLGTRDVALAAQHISAELGSRSGETDTLFLSVVEQGCVSYRLAGADVDAPHGLLWSGRAPIRARVQQMRSETLLMSRGAFEARAERLLGRPGFRLPDIGVVASPAATVALRRHFGAMRREHLRLHSDANPLVAAAATDLTVAVVLAATGLDAGSARSGPSASVRRATAFIDEHLDRPVGTADIAAASGMSVRGLQAAFRRELGETPLQRLRRGRLASAHRDLADADPLTGSVAAIAARWGFPHHGRFAQAYRATYGQSPSRTLRS